MLKNIGFALGGAFIGFTLATAILLPQIQNREGIGRNHGFTSGAFHVIRFLKKNLLMNNADSGKKLGEFLDLKATRLVVIEINGVRTIRIDE